MNLNWTCDGHVKVEVDDCATELILQSFGFWSSITSFAD
jgi:hypothetical protein